MVLKIINQGGSSSLSVQNSMILLFKKRKKQNMERENLKLTLIEKDMVFLFGKFNKFSSKKVYKNQT